MAGLFYPNLNVTATHLNARRLRTPSEQAARALLGKSVEAACASAMATLAARAEDLSSRSIPSRSKRRWPVRARNARCIGTSSS